MSIPALEELKARPQWVAWKLEPSKDGKQTKVPYVANNGKRADSTDHTTWMEFMAAAQAYKQAGHRGLGFVVASTDPYCGIDLDHCRNSETGEVEAWAMAIVERFSSYTEVTPSETGLRIWIKAKKPGTHCEKAIGDGGRKIEIYEQSRFFTVTGAHLAGTPETIEDRQGECGAFYAKLWPEKASSNGNARQSAGAPYLTASEIIDRARRADNAGKWDRLMRGDTSDYNGDDSRADGALCALAAFYTDDPGVIDQIVRMSGLCREKWTERRDYRDRTITKALELVTTKYVPPDGEIRDSRRSTTVTSSPVAARAPTKLPQLASEAYYGPAGEVVQLIEPYIESDRASILIQFLAAFGIASGIRPHFMVGATRHAPTLYLGLIGRSSRARKGTGWDPIEHLFKEADPSVGARIMSGIGSGERLVWLVRDQSEKDEGAKDRRLLIREPELARLLVVVNREGSTMSAYLREAFDGKAMRNEVKGNGSTASFHHIGLIGHCTAEEVRAKLTDQQIRNGLANRIVWALARREIRLSKPPIFEGERVDEAIADLGKKLRLAASIGRLERSSLADELWDTWYQNLSDEGVGLIAAITDRAEAHVTRISQIYALLDGSPIIEVHHLTASLALWDYSVACVEYIWGETTGDPMGDRMLEELAFGPMEQTEIHKDVFYGHASGATVEAIGRLLERQGRIVRERIQTGQRGRPSIRWRLK